MSRKWFDTLPPDLQKIIVTRPTPRRAASFPGWRRRWRTKKTWTSQPGGLIALPAEDQAELMKRMSTIAEDVGKRRPAIQEMYDKLKAAVKRNP